MSLAKLAAFVDERAERPLIVLGSWPPTGRDLDLLVPTEDPALEMRLAEEGFERSDDLWLRFQRCAVDVIDLSHIAGWGLPDDEANALFEEAIAIDGTVRLHRAAPHHALLILARRVGEGHVPLTERRRARVEAALRENPHAWEEAVRRADAWRGARALVNLRDAYRGQPISKGAAIKARSERAGSSVFAAGRSAFAAKTRSVRGTLVAFSGIDGSGKTTQIEHLRKVLEDLGMDPVRVWNRLGVNQTLDVVGVPIKRLLRMFRKRAPATAPDRSEALDPAREWRHQSDVLTFGWTLVVALWNAASQRRATQIHLARGRVVLCDRYTLDSVVNLRYLYGERRKYRWQERLIGFLSPRPSVSILIDVDATTAYARKPIKYEVEDLERYVRLYRAAERGSRVVRIDGTRSEEEICSDVARLVWDRLYRR